MRIEHGMDLLQAKWRWFFALGIVLVVCGGLAVMLPVASTVAASTVLGVVLAIGGLVKVIEAMQVRGWGGCVWQLLLGAVEIVGGILIYLNPMKGALAITLLIAIVFLILGVLQIALAFRVRTQPGWRWLFAAGILAFLVCAAMVMKLRYTRIYTPGTVAGVALLVGGIAYIIIALSNRRAKHALTPA
jgi:uncharacterized membrane protein HdeD (DUF308 family)